MDGYGLLEQFVPMIAFADNLRRRAEELGISNAEVARRAGLSERRYANYVTGQREPDLQTMVRIAYVLGKSPNDLLGIALDREPLSTRDVLIDRLIASAKKLSDDQLAIFVAQVEAVAKL